LTACNGSDGSDAAETSKAEIAAEAATETPAEDTVPLPEIAEEIPSETAAAEETAGENPGQDALVENCKSAVAKETGSKVLGVDRVEQSEAGTGVSLTVEGADAPWSCLVFDDGTVGGVMYTGNEGAR